MSRKSTVIQLIIVCIVCIPCTIWVYRGVQVMYEVYKIFGIQGLGEIVFMGHMWGYGCALVACLLGLDKAIQLIKDIKCSI